MGEIEDLKKEIAQLKAQKEVRADFAARDRERKELQKEKFLLKHENSVGIAKQMGTGFRRIGGFIKESGEKIAKKQKGKTKRKSFGKAANDFFGNGPDLGSSSKSRAKKGKRKQSSFYGVGEFKLPEFKL